MNFTIIVSYFSINRILNRVFIKYFDSRVEKLIINERLNKNK